MAVGAARAQRRCRHDGPHRLPSGSISAAFLAIAADLGKFTANAEVSGAEPAGPLQ
jgi:hypothetical protein